MLFKNINKLFENKLNVVQLVQKREMWAWLDFIFNTVDKSRVRDLGSDLACAQWLLRNGAAVKWSGDKKLTSDYNILPSERTSHTIEEIDASDSSISHYGFEHFKGCKNIKKIILHNCIYLNDYAMQKLKYVDSPLVYLRITSCPDITDKGLLNIPKIESLKTLEMYGLISVKDLNNCKQQIQKIMPVCTVSTEKPS